ncbi:MAG: STAS domain-containing protein [Acidobacteriota bacterium]|nr:STAS domain-containing protein [Acidobacteriota bacterium]MDH3522598.1 STAS domain-containing protein [Acidobacteriota bacterium]
MEITAQHNQGVTVLYPKGRITIGKGDVALREAVLGALDAGGTKILINLKGVSTIDSSGIGETVSAFTTVKKRGGDLKLCELSSKVMDVLQVTQLITVLDVFDSEQEALDSF